MPVPAAGRPPDSDAPAGLGAALAAARHVGPPALGAVRRAPPAGAAAHQPPRAVAVAARRHRRRSRELGARHGYRSPRTLAAALVAPRAKDVSPAMLRVLRARTLRVLVQGHLSQHLIFHSLHQEAGPEAAAELFGVRDTAAFQRLRRLDLSPLRIGRTHGRTRAQMQRGLERELRDAAREGVAARRHVAAPGADRAAAPAAPGPALARRGPLQRPAADGRGQAALPVPPVVREPRPVGRRARRAVRRPAAGAAAGRALRRGRARGPRPRRPARSSTRATARVGALLDRPCSSYGPSLSSDGTQLAYEIAAGNRTYAKRYGNVVVALADMASGAVDVVAGGYDGARVETAYDPALSDDGGVGRLPERRRRPDVAEHAAGRRACACATCAAAAVIARCRAPAPTTRRSPATAARRVQRRTSRGRDCRSSSTTAARARITLVSRIGRRGERAAEAWEPALSHDGPRIAFAATPRRRRARARLRARPRRAHVARDQRPAPRLRPGARDLRRRPPRRVLRAAARRPAEPAGRPAQRLLLRDLASGDESQVSVARASRLVGAAAALERRRARRVHDRRRRGRGRRARAACRSWSPTSRPARLRPRARPRRWARSTPRPRCSPGQAPLQPRPASVVKAKASRSPAPSLRRRGEPEAPPRGVRRRARARLRRRRRGADAVLRAAARAARRVVVTSPTPTTPGCVRAGSSGRPRWRP